MVVVKEVGSSEVKVDDATVDAEEHMLEHAEPDSLWSSENPLPTSLQVCASE